MILWVLHTKCCSGNPFTWDWLTGKGTAGWPPHTKPLFLPQFPMPWSHSNPENLILDHHPQAPRGQGGVSTESAQQWSEFCAAGCYGVKLNKDEWFPDNDSSHPFPYWFCKRLGKPSPFMHLINTKFGLSVFSPKSLKRYHTNKKAYGWVQNWLNSPPCFQAGG